MSCGKKKSDKHPFQEMEEFDQAMRQLVSTPKGVVDEVLEKERKANKDKKSGKRER